LLAAFDISDDYKPVPLEKNEAYARGRRDGEMTLNIIDRLRQYPEYTYVALVGGNHASRGKHYRNNPDFSPMAYLLSQREPIQTVYLSDQGGEYWVCRNLLTSWFAARTPILRRKTKFLRKMIFRLSWVR
jgi:hypothetical protein